MSDAARLPPERRSIDRRVLLVCGISILLGASTGVVARLLTALIGLVTNLTFYGRISTSFASPAGNHLGGWVVVIPVLGGVAVGIMARYGSKAIRGHGIPEAMEQVLVNRSRIPARVTILKPLSAAISIGTGGPFGAEGPIIATGGALGSLVGQLFATTADERKTLLAAGAAAGMSATFGSPVSAVLLAIELLLFELKPRSVIPVALAAATAAGARLAFVGSAPIFAMPELAAPSGEALAFYTILGAIVGLASIVVTKIVYGIEDGFEKLPIHWMWWPALGAIVVGVVGYIAPHTLGVGYDNIENILGGSMSFQVVGFLCAMKFLSWSVSLGSGTSGGTLAPLFTIGGGLGAVLAIGAAAAFPALGVDPRIGALVGMAAMFSGASRAMLTSVVFAFETTRQPMGLLPLLSGCTAAYLLSSLLMKNTIMTEKIVRRGIRVVGEYSADHLERMTVKDVATRGAITLQAAESLQSVRTRMHQHEAGMQHQGFPVVDAEARALGVVTRREILDPSTPGSGSVGALLRGGPVLIYDDSTLREAADHMLREKVGRLPVVTRAEPEKVVGILSRSDLLGAHRHRLDEEALLEKTIDLAAFGTARRAEKTPQV